MENMTIDQALADVRAKLKVPKNKKNEHGGFMYRDLETILREAKPLCAAVGAWLHIDEDIIVLGDRFYIQAKVRFIMFDGVAEISAVGHAREPDQQKGMQASMLTGSTASYAKKAACNNLFLLDDAQDPDSLKIIPISDDQAEEIEAKLKETKRDLKKFLEYFEVDAVSDINVNQYNTAMKILNAKPKEVK